VAAGDPLDDAAPLDLLGDLAPAPVADRAPGSLGRFAGQGHYLADPLGGDRWGLARAWCIGQALLDREIRERYGP
jgi:hypothetical protein